MGVGKDWTFVLREQCDECAVDVLNLDRAELGPRVRAVAGAWREILGRGDGIVRRDPQGDRSWSILEYGCHVRDVFDLWEERTRLVLKKRKPQTFKNWDQEHAAADGGYKDEDPARVAYALASNGGKVADVLDRISDEEWAKSGTRSDGVEFTLEALARYMLHDVTHHLWDAEQLLDGA